MEKMDVDSSNNERTEYKANEVKNSDGVEIKINVKVNEKNLKRKRTSVSGFFQNKNKDTIIAECNKEIDSLLEYYKELSGKKIILDDGTGSSNNSLIACLLEESSIAFSKLVDAIYEKMKGKGVTLAYVRSTVLSVGQRMIYGFAVEDADVLEDESESCLWCWETRDIKLIPFNQRGELNARRLGRKKIHERLSSLSAILSVLLAIPEDQTNYKTDLCKTFTRLVKTLNLEEIRSVVEKKKQKSNCSLVEKAAKLKEKELICTLQKENVNNEKEIKTAQEQSEKDTKMREKEEAEHKKQLKKQQEEAERNRRRQEKEEAEHQKQLKRQQDEAERNRKRLEKEEAEHQKQLKKQQEEAEKSKKRREKEEAELKKQNSVKKQATILEKFLKTNKSSTNFNKGHSITLLDEQMQNSSGKVELVNTVISLMDNALCREDNTDFENIKKFHNDSWCKLRRNHTFCYWGARKKPKVALVKELKLHELSSSADLFGKVESPFKEAEQVEEDFVSESENASAKHANTVLCSVRSRRKKLLQFDKSNRPAYYGTWGKKSCTVGPRHPFKQDPELDYDVDSDEEWEEEEPGESLSDCEKDADEDHVEGDLKIEDEDESEDGFFVPDGYLSENEGVQLDEKPSKSGNGTINGSDQSEVDSEEINELLQQQKYIRSLTEQALNKGHPLIISNLMHEKSELYSTADAISGNIKMEIRCLQALCMQSCAGGIIIDLVVNYCPENEGCEVLESQDQSDVTPSQFKTIISDADLLEYVKSIQSHSLAMHKILESLHAKFPSTSKAQLRNKVKEMSEYIDNQWKVKNEFLTKLGLSTDPSVDQSSENQTDVIPSPPKTFISDSDLLEFVKIIRSNSLGINKIVDLIHAKFPSTSKSQVRSKIKEISDYVDNRWMVKKEILAKLGLSTTPDKSKTRGIASFFLKRFHPGNQEAVNMEKKPIINENVSHNNGIEASTPNKG